MKHRQIKKQEKITGESGMMVVEAVISFTVFLIVVLAIIFLINIFTVHNKIQFAINSAAHELASYSYMYQALGIRDADQTMQKDGEPHTSHIDDTVTQLVDTMNKIQEVYSDAEKLENSVDSIELSPSSLTQMKEQIEQLSKDTGEAVESGQKSVNDVTDLFSDSNSLIVGMIYMGASRATYEAKSAGATALAKVLTKKYLSQDADSYLRSYGIEDGYAGLDFSGSTMFCDSKMQMIDIVVQYDIDMGFAALVLPEEKRQLHVVQRVSVPAWLDGDGQKVEPAP